MAIKFTAKEQAPTAKAAGAPASRDTTLPKVENQAKAENQVPASPDADSDLFGSGSKATARKRKKP